MSREITARLAHLALICGTEFGEFETITRIILDSGIFILSANRPIIYSMDISQKCHYHLSLFTQMISSLDDEQYCH